MYQKVGQQNYVYVWASKLALANFLGPERQVSLFLATELDGKYYKETIKHFSKSAKYLLMKLCTMDCPHSVYLFDHNFLPFWKAVPHDFHGILSFLNMYVFKSQITIIRFEIVFYKIVQFLSRALLASQFCMKRKGLSTILWLMYCRAQ